ncbi:MAG: glycosyltransferase family 9 protein, partial [Melioribacteraceae bacterium]
MTFYKENNNKEGILFVNTGTLGDVVITSLLLDNRNIIEEKGKMFLVIKQEYSVLFKNYEDDVKIVCLEQKKYKWSLIYRIKFLRQLHSYKIKLCVNLTSARGISSDEIALLSGANTVWCFNNSWRKLKKAFGKKMDSYYDRILFEDLFHEYEKHYRLLKLLNNKNKLRSLVDLSPIEIYNLDYLNRFDIPQNYIVIATQAGDRTKAWGERNYKLFCQMITDRVNIILIGSEKERLSIEKIKDGNDRVMNLAGKLKLDEIQALIKRCSLFIGNDSGLSHLALKADIPMIAIIGGGSYRRYFPFKQTDTRMFLYYAMDCFG